MSGHPGSFHPRLLIVANAGSGKTHRLVARCIQLIARGQKPEEILALTFTRKAAAEFLQKLFERLGEAAQDEDKRERLQHELGCGPLTHDQCVRWMRQLIAVLPKLAMGTLDQFFARIVRSFPFELGIGREFELLDEAAQQENLVRTLDHLFRDSVDEDGLAELVEMLRQSNRNRSDTSALRSLKNGVTRLHDQIAGPSRDVPWGDRARIWPAGTPLLPSSGTTPLATAAREWMDEIETTQGAQLTPGFRTRLEGLTRNATRRPPGARMNKPLKELFTKLGNDWKLVKKYNAVILAFGQNKGTEGLRDLGELRDRSERLRRSIIANELDSRLKSSKALHQLLLRYDAIYSRTVRDTGALTFADIAQILVGRSKELVPWIAYRLDGRYKHWLLDEFQDTSRAQWNILSPLIDAVVTDTDNDRTLFYVGDTKQSIYGWRDGDDRLFWEVRDHYNQYGGDHIAQEQLDISWRSDQAVLDVVNTIFDPDHVDANLGLFDIPKEVGDRWRQAWVHHGARDGAGPGYVRLQNLALGDGGGDEHDLAREVVRIVKDEVKPLERGLSCAVLARTGAGVRRYARALKEAGIEVVTEGKFHPCTADPQNLALLTGVRAVASSCDVLSTAHFLASPFGCIVGNDGFPIFRAEAMRRAASDGFAATLLGWVRDAAARDAIDPQHFDSFLDAASAFDSVRRPEDDWFCFIRFLEHHSLEENEAPGAVRVMTIHKAKGLGMDMVILPELGGKAMSQLRLEGIALHRDDKGDVQWGLSMPPKEICELDDVLANARETMEARQAFNELCVFYVAMTRAKHAVYCLSGSGKEDKHPAFWLKHGFPAGSTDDPMRETGDAQWFLGIPKRKVVDATPITGDTPATALRARHGAAPSSHEGKRLPSSLILGGGHARRLGNRVHELLSCIEWLDDLPDLDAADPEAAAMVREFLASERASVLRKPEARVLLWRERAFEVMDGDRSISGIFDRVHITLGDDDAPCSAHIIDFKTDADAWDLESRYAAQLDSYRSAAAILLGIAPEHITTAVVAVRG